MKILNEKCAIRAVMIERMCVIDDMMSFFMTDITSLDSAVFFVSFNK